MEWIRKANWWLSFVQRFCYVGQHGAMQDNQAPCSKSWIICAPDLY